MSNKNTNKPHPFSREARLARESAGTEERTITDMPEIDPTKTYTFVMTNKPHGKVIIPRVQRVWCETTGKIREIRYCKTEHSPYTDEQDETSSPERIPLQFNNGQLKLDGTNEAAIKFLLASDHIRGKSKILPANASVKDRYFLRDEEAILRQDLKAQEDELSARVLIQKADGKELQDFLRTQFGRTFNSTDDAKLFAYNKAASFAGKFLNEFKNPMNELVAQSQVLFEKNVLSDTKGTIKLADTGAVVMTYVPDGKISAPEALARWIHAGSDDAETFKKETLKAKA